VRRQHFSLERGVGQEGEQDGGLADLKENGLFSKVCGC